MDLAPIVIALKIFLLATENAKSAILTVAMWMEKDVFTVINQTISS